MVTWHAWVLAAPAGLDGETEIVGGADAVADAGAGTGTKRPSTEIDEGEEVTSADAAPKSKRPRLLGWIRNKLGSQTSIASIGELASQVESEEITLVDAVEKSSMKLLKRGSEVCRTDSSAPAAVGARRCGPCTGSCAQQPRLAPAHPLWCAAVRLRGTARRAALLCVARRGLSAGPC